MDFEEICPIVGMFVKMGIDKIRLTDGEPLARKKLPNLIEAMRRENALRNFSIAANGILLKQLAKDIMNAGI